MGKLRYQGSESVRRMLLWLGGAVVALSVAGYAVVWAQSRNDTPNLTPKQQAYVAAVATLQAQDYIRAVATMHAGQPAPATATGTRPVSQLPAASLPQQGPQQPVGLAPPPLAPIEPAAPPLTVPPLTPVATPTPALLTQAATTTVTVTPHVPEGTRFGVIHNSAVDHTSAIRGAGIKVVTISLYWEQAEPAPGVYSADFFNAKRRELSDLKASGFLVILDVGIQYPPAWVFQLDANTRFVDQYGDQWVQSNASGKNVPNAIFDPNVRQAMANYIRGVSNELGSDFYGVRIGGGYWNELRYPEPNYAGHTNCYWAFDEAALAQDPVPDWRPGQASQDHSAAQAFSQWYLGELKDFELWQVSTYRSVFPGYLVLMYPGWGIRDGQLASAVANDLAGSTTFEQNGSLQMGEAFQVLVAALPPDPKLVVYTTWLDSNPAWSDDTSSAPPRWSPAKYLASLAASRNLPVWGENSGGGDVAAMKLTVGRARALNFGVVFWMSEDDLFSGHYANLQDYAALISGGN